MRDARAAEQLRQEIEAFNLRKTQATWWFGLQLCVVAAVLALFALIAVISGVILFHPGDYPTLVVTVAAGAILGELAGLVLTIFRIVLQHGRPGPLEPLTTDSKKPK